MPITAVELEVRFFGLSVKWRLSYLCYGVAATFSICQIKEWDRVLPTYFSLCFLL